MKMERFSWNRERILMVQMVMGELAGPGLRWISPERMTSKVTIELKWTLSGEDRRRALRKWWIGMRLSCENWLTAVGMRKGLAVSGEQSAARGSEAWVKMQAITQMNRNRMDMVDAGLAGMLNQMLWTIIEDFVERTDLRSKN